MRKVVFRDGTTTACGRTQDCPATVPVGGTAGGDFTDRGAMRAGRRL
ncbi:hypothetical protein [Streptomyces sp. CdTB01]|nr:hypothetical protein [Streptomyces sp. CdTB01]